MSLVNYERTESSNDLVYLLALVKTLTSRLLSRCKPEWKTRFDQDKIELMVTGALCGQKPYGMQAVLLNHSHLLIYTTGHTWYNQARVLDEQLMVRVSEGSFTDALAALDLLVKDECCDYVTLGTLLSHNDAAYTRLAEQNGFTLAANILLKEV